MSRPLSQDYNEAIQNPATNFADPDLRRGAVAANSLGIPLPHSGNFADVYQVRCPGGSKWAVKCFTREVRGLRERYAAISNHLQQARLPFSVDFQYLEQGIRVRGQWFPVLKMRWVEGLLLNEFVRDNLDRPALLAQLSTIWLRMARRLREARMAHADLQHGNVLLVPGSTASSLAVKLIDYDGMWVPALAGQRSGEVGHPSYQHPQRLREGTYSPEVDRFPLLVVAAALHALALGGHALWRRYDNGDNLLFKEADLRAPAQSALFSEMRGLGDPLLVRLVDTLESAASGRLEETPLLEDLFFEDKVQVQSGGKAAATAGDPDWRFGEGEKVVSLRRRGDGVSVLAWAAAGAAVLMLVLGVVLFATLSGANDRHRPVAERNSSPTPKDHRRSPSPITLPARRRPRNAIKPADTDRQAAAYAISRGGRVSVNGEDRVIKAVINLPKVPFRLTSLDLNGTEASNADMARFKGCKGLTQLNLRGTKVSDLSPLKGLPLKDLRCDFKPERDAEVLRSITTLETINEKPTREFWAEVDAKKP